MAILTYPLNGILYDAEDVEVYNCTRTSGVFASDGHFPASVTGTREVSIGPGLAWMQNEEFHGKAVYNPETVALEIAEADAYQGRIDRIVLRFDKLMNRTTLEVVQGAPSSSPVAPAITRDSYTYELGLYTVNVKASSISVSLSDVGNTFLDDSVCGIMADAVTQIPTQELYDQWYAWFATMQADTEAMENQFNIWFEALKEEADAYMTEVQYDFQVWMNGEKVSFDEWFDTVQDTLDSDTAGKLTNLVNEAQDTADEALEQLATGMVRGFMTDEAEGGEYALLADDSDETHGITLMRPICNCEEDASKDLISDEFQENYTYSEGSYCIYEDTLYVFTADKSAGGWDWSVVKATNVGTELAGKQDAVSESDWAYLDLTSDFANYNSSSSPRYRKSGNIVDVWGIVTPTSELAGSSSTVTIATLPSGYRPAREQYFVCQGSSANRWQLGITTDGLMYFCRYGYGSTFVTASAGTWLPFSVMFMTGDSVSASPQSIDPDDDSKIAPGPEIIDPDDDTGGEDNPDDGTVIGPGPEEVE